MENFIIYSKCLLIINVTLCPPVVLDVSHISLQQKKDVRMLRFIQEVNTTTRSCALWDLEEETDYIVHVQSISMSGTSPLSEPLRFRTRKEAETQASKSKGEHECAQSSDTSTLGGGGVVFLA